MASLKLFGGSKSRAIRSLWALEEASLNYAHVPINSLEEMRSSDFLAINPNGKIPALIDGTLTIFESMCINLYIAEHYAPQLYGTDMPTHVQAMQWSFWAISEIEPLQMDILNNTKFLPKEKRMSAVAELARKRIARPLRVLEDALLTRDWLTAEKFTIADLNVASVMLLLEMAEFDYSPFPHTRRWLDLCYTRPALKVAQAK